MKREQIREFVFEEVYFYSFYDEEEYKKQCKLFLDTEAISEENKSLLEERASLVISHIPEADAILNEFSKGWKTSRMSKVDLAILRLALFEMLHDDNIPTSVAINEAVELAKKFGDKDSYSFINGILGNIAKTKNL